MVVVAEYWPTAELADDYEMETCAMHLGIFDEPQQQQQHNALAVLWWTNAVCLPAIAALGILCNGLNLMVLVGNEQARRMPSWHLLVALALFDCLFLLCAVLELAVPASLDGQPALVSAHTRIVLYVRMFASAFYKASILIVVAFNMERYLCVCRPLWAHRAGILRPRASAKNRWAVIGVALAIGMVCSLQWPLAWHVLECRHHQNNDGTGTEEEEETFSIVTIRESPVLQAYMRLMDWFSLLAFNILPIALLSVLNLQLVFTLRQIVRRDSSASSTFGQSTEQENNSHTNFQQQIQNRGGALEGNERASGLNANAMLFAVVLLLFICIGPQAPARLLYEWHGHYHVDAVLYTCISQQLVFLNASLNFCLYCLVSRRYRAMLKESLHRMLKGIGDFLGRGHRPLSWMTVKFTAATAVQNAQQHQHTSSCSSGTSREEEVQQQQNPFLELMRRKLLADEDEAHVSSQSAEQ